MSSSANNSLIMTTQCNNCTLTIELVVVTSQDTGNEFLFWRHVLSGMFGCYLPGRKYAAEDNMAVPDWGMPGQFKSTDCAGGCCYNAFKNECVAPDCHCHAWK